MLYDFDAYALYYRADLFDAEGDRRPDHLGRAPRRREEARRVDQDGDGKPDKYLYAVRPNTFHFSQFLFQNGGSLLNADNTKATFNSHAGVAALQFQKDAPRRRNRPVLVRCRRRPAAGDRRRAGRDVLRRPVLHGPAQERRPRPGRQVEGRDRPVSKQPGSYLGGTGLGIPVGSKHKEAAWLFIQYHAPARAAGRRLHRRRRGPGHHWPRWRAPS